MHTRPAILLVMGRFDMHVVRPGQSYVLGREKPGPRALEWAGSEGKQQSRKVVVLKATQLEV
jgi:hypothetical protein